MLKKISWDVKTVDMKYYATMAKNKGVSLGHKVRKETINQFVGIMFFVVFWVLFTK